MSEPKAFDVGLGQYCEDGTPCVVAFDTDRNPKLLNEKVYLKSEVDAILAEKDKEIKILQQSLQSFETVSVYRKCTIKEYEVKVNRMRMDITEKDRYISNLKDDVAELQAKYRGCKRELDLLKDTQAFYKGQ